MASIPAHCIGKLTSWLKITDGPTARSLREHMAPTSFAEGKRSASVLSVEQARGDLARQQLSIAARGFRTLLDGMPDKGIAIRDAFESGRFDKIPEALRPHFRLLGEFSRKNWDELSRLGDVNDVQKDYVEHWITHLYENSPAEVSQAMERWRTTYGGKTIGGSKYFLKERLIPNYAIAEQVLGLKPRFANVYDQIAAGNVIESRYLDFRRAIDTHLKEGLFRAIDKPNAIIEGEDILRDSRGNPTAIRGAARDAEGEPISRYVAGPRAAMLPFNNSVSPGIWEGPLWKQQAYKAYMIPTNAMNAAHVIGSGFHFTFENMAQFALESGAQISRGMGAAFAGDVNGVMRSLKGLALSPTRGIQNYYLGSKFLEQFAGLRPMDRAFPELLEAVVTTGTKVGRNPIFADLARGRTLGETVDFEPLRHAWAAHLVDTLKLKGGLRGVVPNVMELARMPIMDYFVHRSKIGSAIHMYGEALKDAAAEGRQLSLADRRSIGFGIQERLDDVMGMVPREHLHFTNAMKDWLHVLFAFPHWQLGSLRVAASAASGVGKMGAGLARGRTIGKTWAELSHGEKIANQFMLGMLVSGGATNALLNRTLSGEWPQTMRDLIAPRTGKLDGNGNPVRVWTPSYFRTYISAIAHPGRWLAGIVSPVAQESFHVLMNLDYWGNEIRDPRVGAIEQATQLAKHEGKQFLPFSVQAYDRMSTQMGETGLKPFALSMIGISPAPKELEQTRTQNFADSLAQRNYPHLSPDESEMVRVRADARRKLKAHEPLTDEENEILKGRPLRALRKSVASGRTRFQSQVRQFSAEDLLSVLEYAVDKGDEQDAKFARTELQRKVNSGLHAGGQEGVDFRSAKWPRIRERYIAALRESAPKPMTTSVGG